MSVFAEPSVVLCGARHDIRYAICCARAGDEEAHKNGHVWVDANEVFSRISHTFTPCQWADATTRDMMESAS